MPLIDYRQHANNTIGAPSFSIENLFKRFCMGLKKYGLKSYKRIKTNIAAKKEQSARLLFLPEADQSKYFPLVKDFVALDDMTHISKICFLIKNKILFSNLIFNFLLFIAI